MLNDMFKAVSKEERNKRWARSIIKKANRFTLITATRKEIPFSEKEDISEAIDLLDRIYPNASKVKNYEYRYIPDNYAETYYYFVETFGKYITRAECNRGIDSYKCLDVFTLYQLDDFEVVCRQSGDYSAIFINPINVSKFESFLVEKARELLRG